MSAVLSLIVTNDGNAAETATVHELLIPFDDTEGLVRFGDGTGPQPGLNYNNGAVAVHTSTRAGLERNSRRSPRL